MAIHTVEPAVRQIARRTRRRKRGPVARLMSPSDDFGEMLKPFVFPDFLDHDVREPITSGLHPHSGVVTVSHLTEGSVKLYRSGQCNGHSPGGRGGVDAGWTRNVARQCAPDRVPILLKVVGLSLQKKLLKGTIELAHSFL